LFLRKFHITLFILCFLSFGIQFKVQAQGKVVINEFLPWSPNNCSINSEFIELMNFGPGPMNIGCYIVTNGKYAVTIPPNTIIQPGEYYTIAGYNTLARGCGNVDSTVQVQLNWNTCNCMSPSLPIPLPSNHDGFFDDGGNTNEHLVLFKPNMEVVDAVTRYNPPSSSDPITTSSIGGQCTSRTFDLDTMSIPYEVMGMSPGQGNSYARTIDGDCEWVKDPPQSAHATNNRAGDESDVKYALNITNARDCGSGGTIDILLQIVGNNTGSTPTMTDLFPMNYAIARDVNNDGVFDLNGVDTYTYGEDVTAPNIDITGLPMSRYRIVVGSKQGCFLATFNVSILPCFDPLSTQILNFYLAKQTSTSYTFRWMLAETRLAKTILVEKSMDGQNFTTASMISPDNNNTSTYSKTFQKESAVSYYRLKVIQKDGKIVYSSIINLGVNPIAENAFGPNPATDKLNIKLTGTKSEPASYQLYNALNERVGAGKFFLHIGPNVKQLTVNHLPKGMYHLVVQKDNSTEQPISFRFVKQ
jgi:hypothetical protein